MDACATEARVVIDPYDSTLTLSSIPAWRAQDREAKPRGAGYERPETFWVSDQLSSEDDKLSSRTKREASASGDPADQTNAYQSEE